LPDQTPDDPTAAAVSLFWTNRNNQIAALTDGGRAGGAARAGGHYQAGWFITTKVDGTGSVSYGEPLATASGKAFRTAVQGRVNYVRSVLD
jgi:hypothetical protein